MANYYVNKNAQAKGDHEVHVISQAGSIERIFQAVCKTYVQGQNAHSTAENHLFRGSD